MSYECKKCGADIELEEAIFLNEFDEVMDINEMNEDELDDLVEGLDYTCVCDSCYE